MTVDKTWTCDFSPAKGCTEKCHKSENVTGLVFAGSWTRELVLSIDESSGENENTVPRFHMRIGKKPVSIILRLLRHPAAKKPPVYPTLNTRG